MQALQEAAQVDAASSLAVLRHLERKAKSERVRLDAALGGLRIGGLDTQQAQSGAQGVAIQIVFRTDAGALLAQSQPVTLEGQADQGVARVDRARDEGEGGQADGSAPPPRGRSRAAKGTPGVENRARPPAAGSPARRGGRKLPGKNSGVSDG